LDNEYRCDVAVVGSGFTGSLMAMIARRLGKSVILLERGKHPRMVIGESSTPLSNLLLEDLAAKYDLPNVKSLAKWGPWQTMHPELACGLKRGFSFFHHAPGERRPPWTDRSRQLLVAASPHNQIADTHWYREHFDSFLMQEARNLGAEYMDEVSLTECVDADAGMRLRGQRAGRDIVVQASFVVDATGPHGFLHRSLKLGQSELIGFPATQALYSHFAGVIPIKDISGSKCWNKAPYPVDDAAVHHIFDGGWVWVLRFNNGVVSAGVVAADKLANDLDLSKGEAAWSRLLQRIPALKEQFEGAKAVQPFRYIPRVGFRSASIAGDDWVLLPSAAGFVDPLLSTGFPLTLLGVSRLAEVMERHWGAKDFHTQMETYASKTDDELCATARLISALYANMTNFPVFTALSLLYFAAASYSETVRRLGKSHLASSFLLHDDPRFGPQCRRVLQRALTVQPGRESDGLIGEIFRVIKPIDVAGFGRRERNGWYPVEAEDLLTNVNKVESTHVEVTEMLEKCGFQAATSRLSPQN
jgi:tetracycline 7-halogenase / FADH2 O2-dependent halogenase